MKNRLGMVVSIVLAAIAALAVRSYLVQERRQMTGGIGPGGTRPVRLVVARVDLEQGDRIVEAVLASRSVPGDYVPGRAVPAGQYASILGRKLRNPCDKGEPLLWTDLEEPAAGAVAGTLAGSLLAGERAVTIALDATGSLAGMLHPSDRVDVIATFDPPHVPAGRSHPTGQGSVTMTLLQNIRVLTVGGQAGGRSATALQRGSGIPVTLASTPEQSQLLIFAQSHARLALVLRPPGEQISTAPGLPVSLSSLEGDPASGHGPDSSTEQRDTAARIPGGG